MASDFDREMRKVINFFQKASKELKEKNRFSNAELDKIVNALVSEPSNIVYIKKDQLFFRARRYTEPDAEYRFLHPKKDAFKGYDLNGSFVNKKGVEGRCNPQFIPYLYMANTVDCCLAEIRPTLKEYVSVAEIKVVKRLKVLSLSKSFAFSYTGDTLIRGVLDTTVVLYLEQLFSKPYEAEGDYLLTQYISEKIKNAKFDGISFYSSVYDGHGDKEKSINYTIFNYQKCESVSSKLYKITSIRIESTCDPMPFIRNSTETANYDDFFEEFEKVLI